MPGKTRTRLPLFHATALDLLATLGDVEIEGKAKRAMAELREIDGIPPVKAPEGLQRRAAPLPGGRACRGCGSSSATGSRACSPTTWAWARRCRRSR